MIEHELTMESDVELPASLSETQVLSLISTVLEAESVEESWQVGIQFVDDPTMQAAHVEFMDIDEPTDIMTFPYSSDDGEDIWGDDQAGGDLMISVDRARANAIDAGWSEPNELYFLITHGILHLLGWDDHSEADRDAMLARQHELLQLWQERS